MRTQVVFGIVLLLAVLAFLPGLDQPGRTPRQALLLVAGPLLLGLTLWQGRARAPRILLALFAVAAVAGILGTLGADAADRPEVLRDLAVLLAGWSMALAAAMLPRDELEPSLTLGATVALGVVGLLGLGQAWLGWDGLQQARPPAANFVNRNIAAQALVLLIPLSLPRLLDGRDRGRWLTAAALGAGTAYVIATRSRGAWIALVVGLLLFAGLLAQRRLLRRPGLPGLLVVLFVLLALVLPTRGPVQRETVAGTLGSLARPLAGSGSVRMAMWDNSLAMLADRPLLGVGAGRFAVEYPRFQAARRPTPSFGTDLIAEHAHNDTLESAAELGFPAAVALLLALGLAIVRSGRDAWRLTDQRSALWAAGRLAALLGLLVHGLVSFPLHSPASALIGWLLVGRACAPAREQAAASPTARVAAWVCLALVPLMAWVGWREIRAEAALTDALHAHAARDCPAAVDAALQVTREASWRRRGRGMSAMVLFDCDPRAPRVLEQLEGALSVYPNELNLLLATGSRRLKAGRPEDAERAFQRAVEILPELGRAWLGLAMARERIGDAQGVAQACSEALRLAPDFAPARQFCR